ncbi:tRNA epoxyqueuosine(34) reductase QueG [Labilibacter sediminis]|nr:tRNA epoxyqueuosine(34) reductase QueG [Labilibacter sediminis]
MDLVKNRYCELIKEKARELGFDDCGFTKAHELTPDKEILKDWIDHEMYGNMHYMANHFEKRTDPSKLVEGAKSVIVLLTNYTPSELQKHSDSPKIARYAFGQDYHHVIKDKLKTLFNFIKTEIYPSLDGRYFVDSAPVLERSLAVRAGLGWIGKNTHLIHKKLGSYVFISELIINLELSYNEPLKDACGGCQRCIEACPTTAIIEPRKLDARRCISYLTIENKEAIPEEFSNHMENRVFGCDICQEVCPWTWKSRPHQIDELKPKSKILELTKKEWQNLSQEQFSEIFSKSAVKRAKYSGLKRNIDFLLPKSQE